MEPHLANVALQASSQQLQVLCSQSELTGDDPRCYSLSFSAASKGQILFSFIRSLDLLNQHTSQGY